MKGVHETSPLLPSIPEQRRGQEEDLSSFRRRLHAFLEAKTVNGRIYERFIILLIVFNVIAFVLGTLFLPEYNTVPWSCPRSWNCDTLWFGNDRDNALSFLGIGATSILELITVFVFSVEYIARLWTADLEDPKFRGVKGRFLYIPTFFSVVDLASTLPFYLDSFLLTEQDLAATQFLRMFRLLRMMRAQAKYDTALTMVDDVWALQKSLVGTALFVGGTVWIAVSSLYYLAERRNTDMIYCGAAPTEVCGIGVDIDTSQCVIDEWGFANCTDAGCPNTADYPTPCWNLCQSIPSASYYALLNLFGEFPLMDQHSVAGMFIGTLTAIVAVAVFALPAGIVGNGFETVIEEQRRKKKHNQNDADSEQEDNSIIVEESDMTTGFWGAESTVRGRVYNFFFAVTTPWAVAVDSLINVLIVGTVLSFMLDTLSLRTQPRYHIALDAFEFASVCVFTIEYICKTYASKEDPKYNRAGGRFLYMVTFFAIVDLLSVLPYWIWAVTPTSVASGTFGNVVKALRLLRILRFERYLHAFRSFDDVFRRNADILAVTAYTAVLVWIFFSACLYYTERDNPDPEMAKNYNSVPSAMWITLLNLSGEAPLCQYSTMGKIITGILVLFATGIFAIPIGLLGAGFEEVVEAENEDDEQELQQTERSEVEHHRPLGSLVERTCYNFVNGFGSIVAQYFECLIYVLILLTVAVGIWQTLPGKENDWHEVEWIAVIVFTVEYVVRLIGVGADPTFVAASEGPTSPWNNPLFLRIRFIFSFYSLIDLAAIIPFYLVAALPNSFLNQYDEYLRMLRILRLVKLDKYIPSITLVDDVFRLKAKSLKVTFYAAISLWILFAGAMFLAESVDTRNDIDPVPDYGCDENCSMADRFRTFFDSGYYVGVHLTGDYPIISYNFAGRVINLFMIIAAVGVVSIPSGIIASGFVEVVQSKNKAKQRKQMLAKIDPSAGWESPEVGDDWYDIRYRQLEGVSPPRSRCGPQVDAWQEAVNELLNGKDLRDQNGKLTTQWTMAGKVSRTIIFTVIVTNVLAVLLESVPSIDKAVGNEPGNVFDTFEAVSVMVFTVEYILRLFSAPKSRQALFSTTVYAFTFFGIVDLLSIAPWFVQQILVASGKLQAGDDSVRIFRIFRIFRILQLEDFLTAFSKLDNVFRASKDVLRATGLLAVIIWIGCGAVFYILEENNPNWRECDPSITDCYDFSSTAECNESYPGQCHQSAFSNLPISLYYTAVFLGGEWGVIDFRWPSRLVALFLCVVGIGLYAIPIGTLFDSFGAVLGLADMDGEDDDEEEDNGS